MIFFSAFTLAQVKPSILFLKGFLAMVSATRTCVPLDLVLPLLVLPLPQQHGLQSEEVLHHDVEEVQLELTAVGFS